MNEFERREVLGEVLGMVYEGCESLVYTAEQCIGDDDVREADLQLYSAMKRLDEAATDMVRRMNELRTEYNLKFNTD